MTKAAIDSAKMIQKRIPNFKPKLTMVTGSGLGVLADHIENATVIPYAELPGFHAPKVEGHAGEMHLGYLKGVPVACLKGRAHFYEGIDNNAIKTLVRTMKLLGTEIWLATNAAGSMRQEVGLGSLVVLKDHINFQFNNPLVGPNDEEFGGRFVSLEDAYDPQLRRELLEIAKSLNIELTEGIYVAVLGPSFETPAEIQAFRTLGGDLVGMSTVPEVIIARHCDMRVAVISAVTNLAAGMSERQVTHDETLRGAKLAQENLIQLILSFIEKIV